jgi:chromosome segregation ATPase
MDNKIASYGLVGISLLLAFGLYLRHDSATQAQKVAAEREEKLLGALKVLEAQGTALRGEADLVTERLKDRTSEANTLSNKVQTLTADLMQTRQSLIQANAAVETVKATVVAAQNETRAVENRAAAERAQFERAIADYQKAVKDRDAVMANLSQANEQMAKQAEQLNAEIAKQQVSLKALNNQIASKEAELLNARGERDLLTRELKTLMAKRDELERQLNDLNFLKEQVAHLKAEQATARRFAWLRLGSLHDERKGAEILNSSTRKLAAPAAKTSSTNAPSLLVVELQRDGTVTLVPASAPTK